MAQEGSELTAEQAELVLTWLVAAGQYLPGSKNQALPLELAPVLSHEEGFVGWAAKHLDNYIGSTKGAVEHSSASTGQQTNQHDRVLAGAMQTIGKAAAAVETMATKVGSGGGTSKKSDDVKPYDVYDMAALMGFCGVDDPADIPAIWQEIKAAKKFHNVRALLMMRMGEFAAQNMVELPPGIFLTKQVVEDIMNITPNETGVVGG